MTDLLADAVARAECAERKWRQYERDYILPCFEWAEESGFNLKSAVMTNPGKNCVELLVRWLQSRARAAHALEQTVDDVRAALGQEQQTHLFVVAQDVEELVRAVERCGDGCRAMSVFKKLRGGV